MEVVYSFIEPIVEDAISKKRAEGGVNLGDGTVKAREVAEGETLLNHLVNYTEGACFGKTLGRPRLFHLWADKKIIMDETMNIMIAGRDTVSSSLFTYIGLPGLTLILKRPPRHSHLLYTYSLNTRNFLLVYARRSLSM